MLFKVPKLYRGTVQSLNVIPFVDILVQLLIFLVLTCQFIEVNNLPVTLPDRCNFADSNDQREIQMTTVNVIKTGRDKSDFIVGSDKIAETDYHEITNKVAALLDARLKDLPAESKVVTLRIDKDVSYAVAQYALAGIAASTATDIRIAVMKDEENKR